MCRIERWLRVIPAMRMMVLLCGILSSINGWSQEAARESEDTATVLKRSIEQAEAGGDTSYLLGGDHRFHEQFTTPESLDLLDPHLKHENYRLRHAGLVILAEAGRRSTDPAFRRTVVKKLIGEIRTDSKETYLVPVQALAGFRAEDFDDEAKRLLVDKLRDWEKFYSFGEGWTAERVAEAFPNLDKEEQRQTLEKMKAMEEAARAQFAQGLVPWGLEDARPEMIKLIGIAGLREALFILDAVEQGEAKRMAGDPLRSEETVFWKTKTFDCLASRARLGDKDALKRMLDRCSETTDPAALRSVVHALGFTKTPEAVEYIRSVLFSTLPQEKAKPGSDAIPPGPPSESAAWALHNMLEGFPEPNSRNMDECRTYMDARPPGHAWKFKR